MRLVPFSPALTRLLTFDAEAPIRGHRAKIPIMYDDFMIDKKVLDEVLKKFIIKGEK